MTDKQPQTPQQACKMTIEAFLALAKEQGFTEVVLIGTSPNGFQYRYLGSPYHAIGSLDVVKADIADSFRKKD